MLPAEAGRAPRAALLAAGALAALALAAAGCGDEDDDAPADAGEAGTELEVTLDPDGPGGEQPRAESVSCEQRTHGSACEELDVTDLAPLDPETPCTEIYGGPDVVTIEGTIAGESVSAALNRANGCEIERFEQVTALLRELYPNYRPGESIAP